MKRYTLYMYAFALSAFALASCSKELTEGLDDVNIGVVTDENVMYDGMIVTAKKGQPVEFTINGEPDFVTFYSGELGHQYIYKDRTSVSAEDVTDAELSFYLYRDTGSDFGKGNARDNNTLDIFYTYADEGAGQTGFPGLAKDNFDADYTAVKDFEWTTMVDHDEFYSLGTNVVSAVNNGAFTLPVKDYIGKNLVIAIAYNKDERQNPSATGGQATNQHAYYFNTMNITATLRNGQEATQYASSFKFTALNLDDKSYTTVTNNTSGRWNLSSASAGNFFIHSTGSANEWKTSWLVSDPINILACEPDQGVSVKNISQDMPTYSHTYENVGTYTATFVVTNGNYKHEDRGVYQIVVNVTE